MTNMGIGGSDKITARAVAENRTTSYCKSVRVYNNTGQTLFLTERNGLPIRIPSSMSRNGNVVIEVIYHYPRDTSIDPYGRFTHRANGDPESSAILEAIDMIDEESKKTLGLVNSEKRNKDIVIRHEIEKSTFADYGDEIYHVELDILLSLTTEDDYSDHPYSLIPDSITKINEEVNDEGIESFQQAMFIVSNNKEVNAKYINYNGLVYRIPSIVNHRLQDGLYVYGSNPTKRDVSPSQKGDRFDIEEGIERYKLYNTPEDAILYGNINDEKEKELERIKQETKRLETELKRERQQHEKEKFEFDKELEYIKRESALDDDRRQERLQKEKDEHERRMREEKEKAAFEEKERQERMQREKDEYERRMREEKERYERRMRDEKEKYDNRSYARKDTSEWIRAIPSIISAALSLVAIFLKLKA